MALRAPAGDSLKGVCYLTEEARCCPLPTEGGRHARGRTRTQNGESVYARGPRRVRAGMAPLSLQPPGRRSLADLKDFQSD
ncbi:hypothetical protein AOLI_G00127240 [Acnodon oligacanthus]